MSIQAAYMEWSATYDTDRNLTRDLDQSVTREILRDLHFRSILELGCGTGKNTGWLATIGEQVIALDLTPEMIEQAQAKHRSDQIHFVIANIAEPWPCKDRTADLVVCNLVLEHIQDLQFIFAQTAQKLIENGEFFLCELHPFRQYQGTVANFQRGDRTIEIKAFTHHLSEYLSVARQSGFELKALNEWWHEQDEGKPPRLLSLLFRKLG
jgi:2-polyprenyl-3-methyl-5-hydroxy-6-metoxy-1,4-benzoquinol methylase